MAQNSQEFFNLVTSLVDWTWQLLNSNFLTALAGAFAGACGAAWIADRKERKRRLLEEIRSTNAAIMLAFNITNSYCGLKKQHVKRLKDNFDSQRSARETFQLEKKQGSIPSQKPFKFELDFITLLPVQTPIEVLKKLLFEKISMTGQPTALVATLSQCIDGLNTALELRNNIIEACKASTLSHDERASIYFGLPTANGDIDNNYPSYVDAISIQTDDCIFFSKLLGEDLNVHGQKLAKSFGREAPQIHKFDFSIAEQEGLIPDAGLYADWTSKFKSPSGNK